MPELGSPEAAVQAAVNLLAAVTKLDERKLAYWLDMYYQLRCYFEISKLPTLFFGPAPPDAQDQTGEGTSSAPSGHLPLEGKAEAAAPEEAPAAPEVPEGFVPITVPESPAAKAAAEKRRVRERFMAARANGVTLGAIRKAANGGITEESLRDIIESKPVPVAVYRVLDKTLDQMEQ